MTTWFRFRSSGAAAASVLMLLLGGAAAHAACSPEGTKLIERLNGNWRGSGTVTPIGGQPEPILCRLSYTRIGDSGVRQSIRCAGTDYRIEATADVTCNGNRISGVWTENIASNTGRINGQLSGQRLTASFEGPNFKGQLAVNFSSAGRHSVTISQFDPAKGRHVPVAQVSLRK